MSVSALNNKQIFSYEFDTEDFQWKVVWKLNFQSSLFQTQISSTHMAAITGSSIVAHKISPDFVEFDTK
jgi:hypothetical protein